MIRIFNLVAISAFFCSLGCSDRPPSISQPSWSPQQNAKDIIDSFDLNGDSQLSEAEMEAEPELSAMASNVDSNSDGFLSEEELINRFTQYQKSQLGHVQIRVKVICDRRPLANAKVNLIPLKQIQGTIASATGTTNQSGVCYPKSENADMPVVNIGPYAVSIDCDSVDLPAKYNTSTELGLEVFPMSEAGGETENGTFEFRLTTR